jgi:hypothetical protein
MRRGLRTSALLIAAAVSPAVVSAQTGLVAQWDKPMHASVVRRTDGGNSGPINPVSTLPNIRRVTLSAWQALNPATDPYTGVAIAAGPLAHLFRVQVTFAGLVNPPGPLGTGEGQEYDPYRYGPSPVYGFLEIDVDSDVDTGGELGMAVEPRYLANVGRFGLMPQGAIAARAARFGWDVTEHEFDSPPAPAQRSGTDFALVLCGCRDLLSINRGGDPSPTFGPGATWRVGGRFFQRSGGYRLASSGLGSDFGLWDPPVELRFAHDITTNMTTVTLVGALDNEGARELAGQMTVQGMDGDFTGQNGNQTSVLEALVDVVQTLAIIPPVVPPNSPTWWLVHRWAGRDAAQYLNPAQWRVTALFGTAYVSPPPDALYVWTDVGFGEVFGDFDASGVLDSQDRSLLTSTIASLDGGEHDCDGVVNGAVMLCEFANMFSIFDTNYDGFISGADRSLLGGPADLNHDGVVNLQDFLLFIGYYSASDHRADLNGDGSVTVQDYLAFLVAYGRG